MPSPTPSTSSNEGSRPKMARNSIDDAIAQTLSKIEKKEPFLDGFTLLVREKMAGIGVELKELAEHLILNVLTLARLGKLTPEHDILEVMTYNVNA